MTNPEKQQIAIAALDELIRNLDTNAKIMRTLGSPYRDKYLELSGAMEMA
jgi:hypothetical protein